MTTVPVSFSGMVTSLSPNLPAASTNNTKLFIGGLSYETTDDSLLKYFSQFGQVLSAVVLRDQDNNRSRGFGFVTFARPESAINALGHHHHIVDGRKVESKFAVPKRRTDSGGESDIPDIPPPLAGPPQSMRSVHPQALPSRATPTPTSARSSPLIFSPNTLTSITTAGLSGGESISPPPSSSDIIPNKIFVGGLRYATTPESLRTYFEEFGEVETAQIIFNRDTKKSRGFGFVVFRDPVSVDRVLARQKSNPPVIEGKQVEVKTCVARQESTGSVSGASSPRAIPQTPIVTRTDSVSSLTSSTSMQHRAGVSATPVRPPSAAMFSQLPPPPNFPHAPPQMVARDQWGISSPVAFDPADVPVTSDRRASFASSVRSSSPFAAVPSGFSSNVVSDPLDSAVPQYGTASPFQSPGFHAPPRESPSMPYSASRFQAYQGSLPNMSLHNAPPIQSQLRAREDMVFSSGVGAHQPTLSHGGQSSFHPPRESAFVPRDGNHDFGLFDMNSFVNSITHVGANNAGHQLPESAMRRPVHEPTPGLMNQTQPLFRPLSQPATASNPLSPARLAVARSPLLDQPSLGGGPMAFSPFPSGGSNIWS